MPAASADRRQYRCSTGCSAGKAPPHCRQDACAPSGLRSQRFALRAVCAPSGLRSQRFALPASLGWPSEAAANGERPRWPLNRPARVGVLAAGEFDEEAAGEFLGTGARGGAEIAGRTICGAAVQSHLPAPESDGEYEMRRLSDPPFGVGLDREFPAVGAELEAVWSNANNLGAVAGVIETQLAGCTVELLDEPIRKDSAEGPGHPGHDDAHRERRARRRSETLAPIGSSVSSDRDPSQMRTAIQRSNASGMATSAVFTEVFMPAMIAVDRDGDQGAGKF